MNFLYRVTEKIRMFMYGRRGPDALCVALYVLFFIVSIAGRIARNTYVIYAAYIPFILAVVRMLSKNLAARERENAAFLKAWNPVRGFFSKNVKRLSQGKKYRFFKCPNCRLDVRVPRLGKTVEITCPRCAARFKKKT